MRRTMALFDFDGTMMPGDSISYLVRRMVRDGLMSIPLLARVLMGTIGWKLGLMQVEQLKTLSLSPLRRLPYEQAQAYCRRFVQEQLLPVLYADARQQIEHHIEEGHVVLIVSASPDCYMRYLADFLKVHHIIASPTNTDFVVQRNVVREVKNELILQYLQEQGIVPDWSASYAYGDSANDLPMLGLVGKPRLINPHRKAMRLGQGIKQARWR